jgi:hypothetical protein
MLFYTAANENSPDSYFQETGISAYESVEGKDGNNKNSGVRGRDSAGDNFDWLVGKSSLSW